MSVRKQGNNEIKHKKIPRYNVALTYIEGFLCFISSNNPSTDN